MNEYQRIEIQELIDKLNLSGYAKLVEALMTETSFTKGCRLNKSAVCRKLGWSTKELEDALEMCKELLHDCEPA